MGYCTPEQAKKIAKLLGDNAPESELYWHIVGDDEYAISDNVTDNTYSPALSIAELWDLLPYRVESNNCFWQLHAGKTPENEAIIKYKNNKGETLKIIWASQNLAESLAAMLIWLLENGYYNLNPSQK